jgi:hypothetical protein
MDQTHEQSALAVLFLQIFTGLEKALLKVKFLAAHICCGFLDS